MMHDLTGLNMMGSSMMGGSFGGFLGTLLFVGLVVLVWLWVIKLWKELMKKR